MCVATVCVCVFIKLHITAQPGPVIYSFYATACNPPGGYLSLTYSWLEMRVHTATTPLPATTALGRNPTPSASTATLCSTKIMGTKTREMVDRLVPFQHMGKAGFSPLCATNRDGNPTNREHHSQRQNVLEKNLTLFSNCSKDNIFNTVD